MKTFIQALFFYCILACFISCSKNNEYNPHNETHLSHQDSVISYFKEVALGYEFGNASEVTRKWRMDMMVFVAGEKDTFMLTELDKIIAEINLLATDGFKIRLTTDSINSNFYLFLGADSVYSKLFPQDSVLVKTNYGLFSTYFNSNNEIINGHMYVDMVRNTDQAAEKHLLREELTQSLGLAKDSYRYPESIFQQNWTTVTSYAPIDKELIKALYNPKMLTGLDSNTVVPILREIVN